MPKLISVFYCYPRSGGTLLNQCLLCAKSTVVLSEVNPASSFLSIEKQAHEWFGLISAREMAALAPKTYLEKVALVEQRCRRQRRRLCVRDWVAVNFIPKLSPLAPTASGVLEQRLFLQESGYELKEAAFLRRSRDIFVSLQKYMPGFQNYSVRDFAIHYREYLEAIGDCPKFHLEEFTCNPEASLRQICHALSLEFPKRFKEEFHSKQSVTGNNTLQTKPASAAASRIKASRAPAPWHRAEPARVQALFASLDTLAGYTTKAAR